MQSFDDYVRSRAEGRDIVRFEVMHARMTGDAVSGLLLSQLVYWHGVNKRGQLRRKVYREGRWWVAKAHSEWKAETWLSEGQAKRAVKRLREMELVDVRTWKLAGRPVTHLSINEAPFMGRLAEARREARAREFEQVGGQGYSTAVSPGRDRVACAGWGYRGRLLVL
jgi:hypothetical protein